MDETKETVLVDEESIAEFVDMVLSCEPEESRELLEKEI